MSESRPTAGRASRGRPIAFDRDAVATIAIALFGERGYDDVSMTDVADAAGVGRRTLFRHFPTKAELIWDGFAAVEQARGAALSAGESGTPFAALVRATLAGAAALPDLDAARTRLRIIAAHPELIAFGSGRLHAGSLALVDYLTRRGLPSLEARLLADGFTVAVFDAYLHWATETRDATPDASIERALALLARLDAIG
jgi:AcrR family transcriptional regulator